MNPTLKIAVVSDIHLGHDRNDTQFIIANLEKAFPDDAYTGELDILFIAGDVFDKLLYLSNVAVIEIDIWITNLLRVCKKHNVMLRVLRGTYSHDWTQSSRFELLNKVAKIGCALKYVDELSIEYIAEHDIRVLYVPDEWNDDPMKTLGQVHELLHIHGIKQVDFAIMHGQFTYQLPPVVKAPKHNEQAYLALVRCLIFIGHVHIYSEWDRIIAQGSFDRLSHGDEVPKGHVRATIRSVDDYDVVFVENKGARIFLTLDCKGLTLEETLQEVASATDHLPDDSFVRLSCSKDNPILTEMDHLLRYRPGIRWEKIVKSKEEAVPTSKDSLLTEEYIPIQITPENIHGLVIDHLLTRNAPIHLMAACERLIKEMRT